MSDHESLFAALIAEGNEQGYGFTTVEPHDFKRLKRWRNRGRCRVCMAHEFAHPTPGWIAARPYLDDNEAFLAGQYPTRLA